jgi:hypothetical protein
MKKKFIVFAILVLGAAGAAFATEQSTHSVGTPSSNTEVLSGPNVSDDRILVGLSHEVFVAKITKQLGDVTLPGIKPLMTQFEVRAIYNIKGNLRGNVVLTQIRGVEPLAQVGSTYLFAA